MDALVIEGLRQAASIGIKKRPIGQARNPPRRWTRLGSVGRCTEAPFTRN